MSIKSGLACACAALWLLGCQTERPAYPRAFGPVETIQLATDLGAADHPRAALHLSLARDEIARANALLRQGDRQAADSIIARAEVDAQLALTLARQARVKREAMSAKERLSKVQGETP